MGEWLSSGERDRAHISCWNHEGSTKNCVSHIDVSHSRQPLVKGERLVRYEVNTVIHVKHTRVSFGAKVAWNKSAGTTLLVARDSGCCMSL